MYIITVVYFVVHICFLIQATSLSRKMLANTSRFRIFTRTMYQNPYINRFKAKSKVSDEFPKKTTGITGLFVNEHPHRTLTVVYGRILKALQQIPSDAAYRKYTEAIVKQRLALVQSENNIEKLEEKIGMGQIEEVIEQAEYELEATRAVIGARAWEPLVEQAPKGQWAWPIV